MFGMMIDIGPKFYAIPSLPLYVTDLEFLCYSYMLSF